jgi:hypothetical protein
MKVPEFESGASPESSGKGGGTICLALKDFDLHHTHDRPRMMTVQPFPLVRDEEQEQQLQQQPRRREVDLAVRLVCPDCRDETPNIEEEFSSGDLVCRGCGLVLGDRIVDTRSECTLFFRCPFSRHILKRFTDPLHRACTLFFLCTLTPWRFVRIMLTSSARCCARRSPTRRVTTPHESAVHKIRGTRTRSRRPSVSGMATRVYLRTSSVPARVRTTKSHNAASRTLRSLSRTRATRTRYPRPSPIRLSSYTSAATRRSSCVGRVSTLSSPPASSSPAGRPLCRGRSARSSN